jgi:hypothetical protein
VVKMAWNDVCKDVFDDNLDNQYHDCNPLLYFIYPLFFIGIGIPLYVLYLWMKLEKTDAIIPFSVGNYAHAQYQNIIDEFKENENLSKCNRWNYKLCGIS